MANGMVKNQIDHIAMGRKWRKSLLDVRSRRGADCGSDHHLVTADIRLKVASQRTQMEKRSKVFDSDRLKNKDTAQKFSIKLQNKFAALEEQPENVEDRWQQIKKVFVETGEEVIGYRKRKSKPWITEETEKKIEERKNLKEKKNQAKGNEEIAATTEAYNSKHREVQRSFRRDKRAWAENLARDAQEAAAQGNSKELYKITKTLANRKFTTRKPIKDKNGNPIVNEGKQMERVLRGVA